MIDVETIFDSDREEYEFMQDKKEQTMKEQIEEIDELTTVLYEANHKKSVLDYHWLATEAYNAGYRKQKEGEWIDKKSFDLDFHSCSLCGCEIFGTTNFCPDCGAHMKGGAE